MATRTVKLSALSRRKAATGAISSMKYYQSGFQVELS